jgi:2-polyprenyl-3-methyl-5-hydroxy-6-metoxy-1,4-benzoquinol methylase
VAQQRYPKAKYLRTTLEFDVKLEGDVLVACEVLEHIHNPLQLMKQLMPRFRYAVISHPIDQDASARVIRHGHHCWVYSMQDLLAWFPLGGYDCLKFEVISWGCTGIAIGKRQG